MGIIWEYLGHIGYGSGPHTLDSNLGNCNFLGDNIFKEGMGSWYFEILGEKDKLLVI